MTASTFTQVALDAQQISIEISLNSGDASEGLGELSADVSEVVRNCRIPG